MYTLWGVTTANRLMKIKCMKYDNQWRGQHEEIEVFHHLNVRHVATNPLTGSLHLIDDDGYYRSAPCISHREWFKRQRLHRDMAVPLRKVAASADAVSIIDARGSLWQRSNGGGDWMIVDVGEEGHRQWLEVATDATDQIVGVDEDHHIMAVVGPYIAPVAGKLVQISIDDVKSSGTKRRLAGVTGTGQLYFADDFELGHAVNWKHLKSHDATFRHAVVHDGELFAATTDGRLVHHRYGKRFDTVYELDLLNFTIGPSTAQDIPPVVLPSPHMVYENERKGRSPIDVPPSLLPDYVPKHIRDVDYNPHTGHWEEHEITIDMRDEMGRPIGGGSRLKDGDPFATMSRLHAEHPTLAHHTLDQYRKQHAEDMPPRKLSKVTTILLTLGALLILAVVLFVLYLAFRGNAQQPPRAVAAAAVHP